VPPAVQIGLERFLIGGIVLMLVAFISIGIGITVRRRRRHSCHLPQVEAFAASSSTPLPEDTRHLIVDVMEPLFTPTLVAGFGCSVSLGLLKVAQFSSDGVQYSEGAQYSEDD